VLQRRGTTTVPIVLPRARDANVWANVVSSFARLDATQACQMVPDDEGERRFQVDFHCRVQG
jgi:hypothetical protein